MTSLLLCLVTHGCKARGFALEPNKSKLGKILWVITFSIENPLQPPLSPALPFRASQITLYVSSWQRNSMVHLVSMPDAWANEDGRFIQKPPDTWEAVITCGIHKLHNTIVAVKYTISFLQIQQHWSRWLVHCQFLLQIADNSKLLQNKKNNYVQPQGWHCIFRVLLWGHWLFW